MTGVSRPGGRLGNPLTTTVGTTMHTPDATPVQALVDRVLGPYERKPEAMEITRLTAALRAAGTELLVPAERLRETDGFVDGALRDWHQLTADGPSDGALGDWNHLRGLARVVRTLSRAIESAEQPPYQGSPVPLSFSFGRMPT